MPKVTVLMPTYNVAPYVKEAVESVLRQTYDDFELLVIDDCSTDNTLDVVREVDDSRIRVVRNERNLGLADNLNRGLSLITTEYVARMDGDDIALPYWLEKEMNYLESHPEVGICGGGGERFGTTTSTILFPERHEDIAVNMLFQCTIIVPTFRMSLYHKDGLRYRSDAFPAEDYRFWADALEVTRLHNIGETLFRYRMHSTQICSSRKEEQLGKVVEVQKQVLGHIVGMTSEDVEYFTGPFIERIGSPEDLRRRRVFANRLLTLNSVKGFFNSKSLRRRLSFEIQQNLYQTIVSQYFNKGYGLSAYLRYLKSGLALRTGWHYEMRFFLKSMMRLNR